MKASLLGDDMQPDCVNLFERFGKRYRIAFDPAYSAKHRQRENLDPWMMVIPCRRGEIYPFEGTRLAVNVEGHSVTRKALRKLPCCEPYQQGDDFESFLFDAADFGAVAALVLPRKRRQVTDAERQRLAEMGAKFGFRSHQSGAEIEPGTRSDVSA